MYNLICQLYLNEAEKAKNNKFTFSKERNRARPEHSALRLETSLFEACILQCGVFQQWGQTSGRLQGVFCGFVCVKQTAPCHFPGVLVTFLLVGKDIMTKATYKRKYLIGSLLQKVIS